MPSILSVSPSTSHTNYFQLFDSFVSLFSNSKKIYKKKCSSGFKAERADSRTDFKSDREGIETPTRRHKHNDSDNQNSKRRNKSAVTWSETNRHQQGEREWTPVQVERYRELGMRRAADILNRWALKLVTSINVRFRP